MTTNERTADVLIVGGGVIGCAIARRAARDGLSVVVLERGTPGMEASWAAAGMLSPLAEADGPGPFLDLLVAAREIYPMYAATLREETRGSHWREDIPVSRLFDDPYFSLQGGLEETRHVFLAGNGLRVELRAEPDFADDYEGQALAAREETIRKSLADAEKEWRGLSGARRPKYSRTMLPMNSHRIIRNLPWVIR